MELMNTKLRSSCLLGESEMGTGRSKRRGGLSSSCNVHFFNEIKQISWNDENGQSWGAGLRYFILSWYLAHWDACSVAPGTSFC